MVFQLTLIIKAHNIDNESVIQTLNQLQGKGLISKRYRPIDTTITSKTPHPTPSQSLISPSAENHVNDTSVNNIINKPIPSMNCWNKRYSLSPHYRKFFPKC